MQTVVEVHPSDDALELYALGKLPSLKVDALEEHLIVCAACQDRLTEVDSYVTEMKQVCREIAVTTAVRKVVKPSIWADFIDRVFRVPAPILVGAAALLAFGVALPELRHSSVPNTETEVRLVATRGPAETPVSAPGNLRLNIAATDLPPATTYQVAVVSSGGKTIWRSEVRPQASNISVRLPMHLDAGTYWVRVSAPNGDPLREFSLSLR